MRRLVLLAVIGAALVTVTGCGGDKSVEAHVVEQGPIRESFQEPARTRLEVRQLVSMPVAARTERIDIKPGDIVRKGQELIIIDRLPYETAKGEAQATVAQLETRVAILKNSGIEEAQLVAAKAEADAATARVEVARLAIDEQQVRADRAASELRRLSELSNQAVVSDTQLEDAESAASTAALNLKRLESTLKELEAAAAASSARATIISEQISQKIQEAKALESQLDQAREVLRNAEHLLAISHVKSPVDGVVLERYEIGGGPLAEGQRVFLIGDLAQLEVEADVLTQDGFSLAPGADVVYTIATGVPPLTGKVSRVEPAAFTKLSSLGVEQQRVMVISTLDSRPETLGLGFRLQARYFKGQADDALIVPRSAVMQAPDQSRFVYLIKNKKIQRQPIEQGLRTDFEIQVTKGVNKGDLVVLNPDSTLTEGMSVKTTTR